MNENIISSLDEKLMDSIELKSEELENNSYVYFQNNMWWINYNIKIIIFLTIIIIIFAIIISVIVVLCK